MDFFVFFTEKLRQYTYVCLRQHSAHFHIMLSIKYYTIKTDWSSYLARVFLLVVWSLCVISNDKWSLPRQPSVYSALYYVKL